MKKDESKGTIRAQYAKERGRHNRFKSAVTLPVLSWIKRNTEFSMELPNDALNAGPAIIATNHACIYDFMFVFAAFRKMDMAYVASEHILRVKPWGTLLNRYVSLIPHKKGAKTSRTAVKILERLSLGESVYLAVEGEQTWDGKSLEIRPGNGKLAKKSGASLITYRIEGSYLIRPRWAKNTRRGRVACRVVNVYTPDVLAEMTAEEVDEAISRDLYFDVWQWQETQNTANTYKCAKGGLGEGLERALCSCPRCRNLGTLESGGDEISCNCGFRARFSETGFFESEEGPKTISEWDRLDEEAIAGALEKAVDGDIVFSDEEARLYSLDKSHSEKGTVAGELTIECREGSIVVVAGGEVFKMEDIDSMTMVQANRLLFSTDKDYYEIRSDSANLRKYMQAFKLKRKER